jgi:hypothetical protein
MARTVATIAARAHPEVSAGFQFRSDWLQMAWQTMPASTPIRGVLVKEQLMKRRNMIVAQASVAITCAVIGTGALVSSHAMAASNDSSKASVTVVTARDGNQPVSCTFDDVNLPTNPPPVGAGTPGPRFTSMSGMVTGGKQESGSVSVAGSPGEAGKGELHINSHAADGGPLPDLPKDGIVSTADARPGTAAECAAIRSDFQVTP